MSYSGELAYEIHVPADRGRAMWEAVIAAGAEFGIMPYGTEAMSTLRIEKGHVVVGAEADGRTTADDLGMGKLVSAAQVVRRQAAARAAGADRRPTAGSSSGSPRWTARRCRAARRSSPIPTARRRTRCWDT